MCLPARKVRKHLQQSVLTFHILLQIAEVCKVDQRPPSQNVSSQMCIIFNVLKWVWKPHVKEKWGRAKLNGLAGLLVELGSPLLCAAQSCLHRSVRSTRLSFLNGILARECHSSEPMPKGKKIRAVPRWLKVDCTNLRQYNNTSLTPWI